MAGMDSYARAALCALYLPGLLRACTPSRKFWPAALAAALTYPGDLALVSASLRRKGLSLEAMLLEDADLMCRAQALVSAGRVLTAACEAYPARWPRMLGAAAPPALWKCGEMRPGPYLAVVGSRAPSSRAWMWSRQVAVAASELGFSVCSGGAAGCDAAAAAGAGDGLLVILPCGLRRSDCLAPCMLSACPPDAAFSSAAAMERNALVYSVGSFAAIGQARFKEGGTWTGAVSALRRRLCRMVVREDPADPAARALVALGAVPLGSPEELGEALARQPVQPPLSSSPAAI